MLVGILISGCLVALTTVGQLLLKYAAHGAPFRRQALLAGYASFLITVAGSFLLMHFLELKYFVVIMSLNYVSVMIASALFFKEPLDSLKIIGTGLVVGGALIFAGAP